MSKPHSADSKFIPIVQASSTRGGRGKQSRPLSGIATRLALPTFLARIVALACCLLLPSAGNAAIHYFGYLPGTDTFFPTGDLRFYQGNAGDGPNSVWGLNGATNEIYNSNTGMWIPLNTAAFTVNDILDITYTDASYTAYLRTTAGDFGYLPGSDTFFATGDLRFYQGNAGDGPNSVWGLNGATNEIYSSNTGLWIPLNTASFTVNDILDITYTDASYDAYLRTTVGNFIYLPGSDMFVSAGDLRLYQGNAGDGPNSVWGLDGATNEIYSSNWGVWKPLNTAAFTVNDILDITYTDASYTAYLRVQIPDVVPEPGAYVLLPTGLGMASLVVRRRRRQA